MANTLYLAKIKESRRARNIINTNFFAPDEKTALEYAHTKYFPGKYAYVINCREATIEEINQIQMGEKVDL